MPIRGALLRTFGEWMLEVPAGEKLLPVAGGKSMTAGVAFPEAAAVANPREVPRNAYVAGRSLIKSSK
jgi:hypothetical protein